MSVPSRRLNDDEEAALRVRVLREAGYPVEPPLYPARSFEDIVANRSQIGWIVDRYFPQKSVGLLFGKSNTFKSFIAIDVALSIATGLAWHGHQVARSAVLYVSGEGALRNRFDAWARVRGVELADPALWGIQMPVPMDTVPGLEDVEIQFRSISGRLGLAPGLVVFDTLARMLSLGGDRNPDSVNPFLRHADQLRERLGCSVLVVHHVGHSEANRPRGMSDLPGAADFAYQLEADAVTRIAELRPYKMKEAEPPAPLSFKLQLVDLPDIEDNFGHVSSSLVPEITLHRPAAQEIIGPRGKWQHAVYEVMRLSAGSPLGMEQLMADLGRSGIARGKPAYRTREIAARALVGLERAGLVIREGQTFRAAGRQADLAEHRNSSQRDDAER